MSNQEAGCETSAVATTWAGDGTILAWNAVAMGRGDVPTGGAMEVAARDDEAATDKGEAEVSLPSKGRCMFTAGKRRRWR